MKTWLRVTVLLLTASVLAACAPDQLIVDKGWIPRRITGNVKHFGSGVYGPNYLNVEFRNREQMRSDVVELEFIGQLDAREGVPYNVYSGRRCHSCESNRSIYIHSAADGRLNNTIRRYRYPGRLYSSFEGSLVEENRVFLGDCMPGYSAATIVWFQRTRLDRVDWEDRVILVESDGITLNRSVLTDPAPKIEPTLGLVEKQRCRELPGRQLSTEP